MQHDVLHPPLRAIWGSAFTFSAKSIPVTLRSLSICYSRFVFTKKFELNITTPHLDRNILCIIQPKLTYRQKKSTFMSAIEVSSAEVSPSCTWYKIIAIMLFLDIFAPLQQILNMIWRWLGECCSWIILHRCTLYQIFYKIQRWVGECCLGYFLHRCRLQQILCGERKLKKPNPLSIKTQIKISIIVY